MDVASTAYSPDTPAAGNAYQTVLASDFQTFLKMLTVQMQNQDPLNPIEASDYAVQLATFSGVEQQVLTNQLLDSLHARLAQTGLTQHAALVGQEARTTADIRYAGEPVTVHPAPAAGADRAVLVVCDTEGRVIAREEIPPQAGPYLWFGGDAAGNPLPQGRYGLSVESWRDGEAIGESPVGHYATITEIRSHGGTITLVLDGGDEVPAEAVTALRAPQG